MAKPRRPNKNISLRYSAEFSALMREVEETRKSGISFDFEAPTKPEAITEKHIREIKALREYVKTIKATTPPVITSKEKTIKEPEDHIPRISNPKPYIHHPRTKGIEITRKLSPEERSKIASEAAQKRIDAITDEERKKWYSNIIEKTKIKYTDDELTAIRSKAAKKAAQTRKEKLTAEIEDVYKSLLTQSDIFDRFATEEQIYKEAQRIVKEERKYKKQEAEALNNIDHIISPLEEFEANLLPEEKVTYTEFEAFKNTPANEGLAKYENIISILRSSPNQQTADFLIEVMENQRLKYGDEVFYKHFDMVRELAELCANGIFRDSKQEELLDDSKAFLNAILIDDISEAYQTDLEHAIEADIPINSYSYLNQTKYKKRY